MYHQRKKYVDIEYLIKKDKKTRFSIQIMFSKSKEKAIGTCLKLANSLVKPVILYACECWDDSIRKEIFANKIATNLQTIPNFNVQTNTRC